MDVKDYQKEAARTLIDNPGEFTNQEMMTIWGAVGLAGEAGEVSELIKKGIFHRHGLDPEKLRKELGDVLWYVASICTVQGFDMGEIMSANIEKLRTRYPDGFSTADSVKRVDVEESDFDICDCGHSRKYHRGLLDTTCTHKDELGHFDECTEFTLAATVAHAAPVEMCECGHEKKKHLLERDCTDKHDIFGMKADCQCKEYTPIPALLHGEQINLFDTDK